MRKNSGSFVDYRLLKARVSIMMILDHYRLQRELKGRGHVLRGPCPIHGGSNPKQFTVNIREQSWFCFGDCRWGGSILDLVAALEGIEIREAAVRIAARFSIPSPRIPCSRSHNERLLLGIMF